MPERIFGHIVGYPEGSWFESRSELSKAGVHRPIQAGISGSGKEGADSIVLSGGYEDDRDEDGVIIYTGQGGRNPATGQQYTHQTLTRGNLALAVSKLNGLPVRVIRAANQRSGHSHNTGYRYDGLFMVEDCWQAVGKSGFNICLFRLVKIIEPKSEKLTIAETASSYEPAERRETITDQIVRDAIFGQHIKELYNYECQICGVRLECSGGPYAEAAHIRPLGSPYNGPDTLDNMLCLCPNHHVLFDNGGVGIADDFSLIGEKGALKVNPQHHINIEHIRYHRKHYPTR